jgi:ApaG protein
MFVYRIRITNQSSTKVKLINRHWIITDAEGVERHVRGSGVVGAQPELEPGGAFEYRSACPLRTATGSMKGEYEFHGHSEGRGWITSFLVDVGEFGLTVDGPKTA